MPRYVKQTDDGVWIGYEFLDVPAEKLEARGWKDVHRLSLTEARKRYGLSVFPIITAQHAGALGALKLL